MSDYLKRNALGLLLALSVLLRVGAAFYLGDTVEVLPGTHDQISYDALAQNVAAGKGFVFDRAWYPFTPPNTPTAHWSFLYVLYLAGVYTLFGYHPLVARLVQAVLAGFLLPWLTYRLGHRLFGRLEGIIAAAWVALYAYFIYHNAALMTETYYLIAVMAIFDIAYEMVDSGDDGRWWLLGLLMGVAVLLRQVYLFFVPALLIWMARTGRTRISLLRLFLAACTVVLCILPWTVRNYLCYGQFLLLNSNGGYAFYTANHPAQGDVWRDDFIAAIPSDLVGANEAQLDSALMIRGLRFVVADPERYLKLTISRLPYHFRFWPTPGWRFISNLARVVSFGLALPFMCVGLILSARAWRRCLPLYAFIAMFIALHVLSWPGPRYRFAVDMVLLLFAGLAVSTALRWLGRGRPNSTDPTTSFSRLGS